MSHPSRPQSPAAQSTARHAPARAQSAAAVSRHLHRGRSCYVFAHGARQLRVAPALFWSLVATLVVMGVWTIATATYFTFRDDVLTRLISRQTKMQLAYEDRIADLRAQVDRMTSRQLLDQDQVQKRLDGLLQRLTTLEARSTALANDLATTGATKPPRNPDAAGAQSDPIKPSPISDTVIFVAPPDRDARLQSRDLPPHPMQAANASGSGIAGRLDGVSRALDKIDGQQTAALARIEQRYEEKARRMRGVLTDLGISAKTAEPAAVGGPFIPLNTLPGGGAFERQLLQVDATRAQIREYARALVNVPVRKPVNGEIDMSSPFGARLDPFMGRPAMHTGVDLRGDLGEPVHATASGTVTIAGWEGGYGRMVQIEHGRGLATRYGHLSEIDVAVGQTVHVGEIIGKIGSTGRSTGPHLHYETRVNGEPVDPQKFLRAGIRLAATR